MSEEVKYIIPKMSDPAYRQAVDKARDDYWKAKTREQERDAYARLKALGLPPAYDEDDGPEAGP